MPELERDEQRRTAGAQGNGDRPPQQRRTRPPSMDDARKRNSILIVYTIIAFAIVLSMWVFQGRSRYVQIRYSEFATLVQEGKVKSATLTEDQVRAELTAPTDVKV